MLFSFPIDAWLLLLVAVGLGLALEVAFYRARRGDRSPSGPGGTTPGPGASAEDPGSSGESS